MSKTKDVNKPEVGQIDPDAATFEVTITKEENELEREVAVEQFKMHQNHLQPKDNKFHKGNGSDGKHYWLTPPKLYRELDDEFHFDFDPCPYPKPDGFDGLTCEWGQSNYVNPPFGSIMHQGLNDKKPKKKGPTAWIRKAIEEQKKGKLSVVVFPIDKWVLMALEACGVTDEIRNLGDVKWVATEDGSVGKGTGRWIACFIFKPQNYENAELRKDEKRLEWLMSMVGWASTREDIDRMRGEDDEHN